MSALTREPEPLRPVRIVMEGDARPLSHDPNLLRFQYPSGRHTIVDTGQLGVTVEDLVPPREWTDGDVVEAPPRLVYVRSGGLWRGYDDHGRRLGPWSDDDTTRDVDREFLTVLRYQAGE